MNEFIIAQGFGLVALIVSIITILQNTSRKFILYTILQNIFSALQYLLLNKIIAFILCVISIVRLVIYIKLNKYSNRSKIMVLFLFIIINFTISLITYTNYIDIFPMVSAILVCYTVWQKNIVIMKVGVLISKSLWGIYAIFSNAYFAIIMDIIIVVWTIIMLLRLNYLSKK